MHSHQFEQQVWRVHNYTGAVNCDTVLYKSSLHPPFNKVPHGGQIVGPNRIL